VAALFAWLTAVGLGLVLLATWLMRIGSGDEARSSQPAISRPPPYIPASLVMVHLVLAVCGLLVWAFYLVSDAEALAWLALAMLLPVELLGFSMFIRWLGSRRLRWAAALAAVYHLGCWSLTGRTVGALVTGQRLVSVDGSPVAPWQAVLRLAALPLAVLACRAVHDEAAATEVIEAQWTVTAGCGASDVPGGRAPCRR